MGSMCRPRTGGVTTSPQWWPSTGRSHLPLTGQSQMALQMRQVGRQMTWSHAVRAFMLRYAAGNAFATCKALGLVDEQTTMLHF